MAFVNLIDGINEVEGVIFPDTYKKIETMNIENKPLIIQGKFENRNGKMQIIINQIDLLEDYKEYKIKTTSELVVRNVFELNDWVTQNHKSGIKVTYFNDEDYTSHNMGYLNSDKGNIKDFIDMIGYENIRLI